MNGYSQANFAEQILPPGRASKRSLPTIEKAKVLS
jgi:hypothetical protein